MLKLIHAADFHLDAPFAALPPERAAERREEQRQLLTRLAELAEAERADLVLLDTRKPHWHPRHDVVANVAYCAKAADVTMVVVDGEPVVEEGRLLHADLPALFEKSETIVRRIAALR